MHKLQGMTIKNVIVIKLGRAEMGHRLMHVALSRVTKFNHIGLIDGISMNRLCKAISRHSKIEGRINEEKRLQMLCKNTSKYFS